MFRGCCLDLIAVCVGDQGYEAAGKVKFADRLLEVNVADYRVCSAGVAFKIRKRVPRAR